ncbi:hypothetical protein BHE90_010100 [Fusarium euwallaceae]|uniref:JmjC domain-containing protein n=1 Tax=Fusarium euwallaceae TaxID=1147111 RepID=A0A430LI89_9HYPO|nr:hypothetical protein BHE90_010100 [Fusarium euwallaceae]
MGRNMTATLEKLTTTHGFDQLFRVTPLPIPHTADLYEVFTLGIDADVKANTFIPAGDGAVHVLVADVEPDVDFQWPDFTTTVERPSLEEATEFLEDTIKNPPSTVPHFGGTFEHTLKNESPLHPGDILADLSQLIHANEEYAHIGARSSTTCMHKEDAGFLSCNVVDTGYKIWLLPDIEHNDLFEKAIRGEFGGNTCDQWVRHLSLAVTPTWLNDRGIRHRIVIQGPGQMMVTRLNQYHLVINYSACLARSINFIPPGQQMSTKVGSGITACPDCGLWPLYTLEGHFLQEVEPLDPEYFLIRAGPERSHDDDDEGGTRQTTPGRSSARACTKRKASGELAYRPSKRARVTVYDTTPEPPREAGACRVQKDGMLSAAEDDDDDDDSGGSYDELRSDTDGTADEMTEAPNRLVVAPTAEPDLSATDEVYRMAAAVCSKHALKQFADMVSHMSDRTRFAHGASEAITLQGVDPDTRPFVYRCIQVSRGEARLGCERILGRYNDLQLFRVYRQMRGDAGRMDTSCVEKVMSACNMTKSTLRYHLNAGKQWEYVCGIFGEGLLAFIPDGPKKVNPFNVNMDMYKALGKRGHEHDLVRFHELIDCEYIGKICQVATGWFDAIDSNKPIKFKWQRSGVQWDCLDHQGVLEMIQVDEGEE